MTTREMPEPGPGPGRREGESHAVEPSAPRSPDAVRPAAAPSQGGRPPGERRRASRPWRGRRLGDPPDRRPTRDALPVRGRLAGVSIRASLLAGAWVGFALGLALGTGLGAAFVWFAGRIVDWQRDLAFTLGITQRLLPFGDQVGLLRTVESSWYVVIPSVGLLLGCSAAIVGALIGGLIAATYNRSPRHALVIVELPRDIATAVAVGDRAVDAFLADPASEAGPVVEGPVEATAGGMIDSRPHVNDREE